MCVCLYCFNNFYIYVVIVLYYWECFVLQFEQHEGVILSVKLVISVTLRVVSFHRLLTRLRQVKPGLLQFYISKLWLFKLFTCADPGPITNSSDYVCVHGAIRPTEYENIEEKLVALSDTDWGYLHNKYVSKTIS